ncbi:MAG: ECF transporter S component [Clostridiales bacterium]|jgi:uncharacterized membrane protein|nr:ECF transporter S component [Clostridiales bacterium]
MSYFKLSARDAAIIAILSALTFILAYVGTINLGIVEMTLAMLPIIVASLTLGPFAGGVTGLIAGFISMFVCLTFPRSALDPFIAHPLVCVLPRVAVGVLPYYLYRLIRLAGGKLEIPASAAAAVFGSVLNTAGVLGMLYVVYARDLAEKLIGMGMDPSVVNLLWGIAAANGIPEMIAAFVLVTPVVYALKAARLSKVEK